jgi:TetR/AcrR family transcriptional repressor of nem operon
MARPKEFDRDIALQQAIKVFSNHGYEGTSTDALLKAMRISRQSLYDTFGDKRRLYLEALQRYNADSVSDLIGAMNASPSSLAGRLMPNWMPMPPRSSSQPPSPA